MLNAVKKSSFHTALQLKVIKHAEHHSNRVVAIIIGVAMYMYILLRFYVHVHTFKVFKC